MDAFLHNAKQKLRDWGLALRYAAFPEDRPSPIFPIFASVLNAIPLVWGFAVLPGASCQSPYKAPSSVGLFIFFFNMVFSTVLVLIVRMKIKAGIRSRTTTLQLFLHPVLALFCAVSCMEVIWAGFAGTALSKSADDVCRRHLFAQLVFVLVYIIVGATLFTLTFITEIGQRPRWRGYAAMRYHRRVDEPPLGPPREGEEEGGAASQSDASGGYRRRRSRSGRQPSGDGGEGARSGSGNRMGEGGEMSVRGTGDGEDDATAGDEYSTYTDDEPAGRTRRVRFTGPAQAHQPPPPSVHDWPPLFRRQDVYVEADEPVGP